MLFLSALLMSSQDKPVENPYQKPRYVQSYFTDQLDTLGGATATLGDSVFAYRLRYEIYLATPIKGGYKVLDLEMHQRIDSIWPFDFTGDGQAEYVLYTSYLGSRTGWESGWREEGEDLVIVDAAVERVMLELDIHNTYSFWQNTVDYHEEDSLKGPEILDSEGIYECGGNHIVIDEETKYIYVTNDDSSYCDRAQYNDIEPESERIGENDRVRERPFWLRWTADGFVREEQD